MSSSPLIPNAEQNAYRAGWAKLNKSLRAGGSWSGREPNSLFLNPGDGSRFFDAGVALGFAQLDDGRALVPVDWDGDGDRDWAVSARTAPRFRLLDNRTIEAPRSIELIFDRLSAALVGTRVEVTTETRRLVRVLRAGEGYLSVDDARLFFGLGDESVVSATIAFGGKDPVPLEGLGQPGAYRVLGTEPQARSVPRSRHAPLAVGALQASPANVPVNLARPIELPKLTMRSKTGGEGSLFGIEAGVGATGAGQRVLVLLWASWCSPCLDELASLAKNREVFDGETLVLALSLDEEPQEALAFSILDQIQWPGRAARATGETHTIFEALFSSVGDRRDALTLPASVLVDERGRAVRLQRGPWTGSVDTPDLDALERRAQAVLDPGRWLKRTKDLGGLAFNLRLDEFGAPKSVYQRRLLDVDLAGDVERAGRMVEAAQEAGEQGRLAESLRLLEQAILLAPEHHPAHYSLGVALSYSERPQDALSAFKAALRLDPEDESSWQQVARLSLGLGTDDWQEALDALRSLGSPTALAFEKALAAREPKAD